MNTDLEDIFRSDEIIRVRMPGDGSCFFHAVLHATCEKYRILQECEKPSFTRNFRTHLAASITVEQWYENCPEMAKLQFTQSLSTYCDKAQSVFNEQPGLSPEENIWNSDDLYFFKECVKQDGFCSKLIEGTSDLIYTEFKSKLLSNAIDILTALEMYKELYTMSALIIEETYTEQVLQFIQDTEKHAHTTFMHSMGDSRVWADQYTIAFFQTYFDFDIYFLIDGIEIQYKTASLNDSKNAIVLFWDGSHFDVLGRKLGEAVQYEFASKDELIQTLRRKHENESLKTIL